VPASSSKHTAADWRALIAAVMRDVWPELDDGARWIEAQVHVESAGNPSAISHAGARGLLQLMPATAREMGVRSHEVHEPIANLRGGIRYLRIQHERFPEIPDALDRLRWAFAAYNGGRGYCNKALALARAHSVKAWHVWEVGRHWLSDDDCRVKGRAPDYHQIWNYVARIERKHALLVQLQEEVR
jgi:membrane-bound lytic murein transglycosylase MltF